MFWKKLLILIILITNYKICFASDMTPVAVVAFALPLLLVGALTFIIPNFKNNLFCLIFNVFSGVFCIFIAIKISSNVSIWFLLPVIFNILFIFRFVTYRDKQQLIEAPGYAWVCQACSSTNAGDSKECINCACPANASQKIIEKYINV